MTIERIQKRIAEITHFATVKHDNEVAHIEEDDLYIDVLKAIAKGTENAQELAREALLALDIEYTRWHA